MPEETEVKYAVAQFAAYTDRWGREYDTGNFPCFVSGVRRASLAQPAAWTWPSGLPEGDTLRMHVVPVGGAAEVIMGRIGSRRGA